MVRFWLRLISVSWLAALVFLFAGSQAGTIYIVLGRPYIFVERNRIDFGLSKDPSWMVDFVRVASHGDYFVMPSMKQGRGGTVAFVPWWLILALWGILMAVVWRLTRRRKGRGAFPVEAAGPK